MHDKTTVVQLKNKSDGNPTTPAAMIPLSQFSNDSTDDEPSINTEDVRDKLHWWRQCKSGSSKAPYVWPTDDW